MLDFLFLGRLIFSIQNNLQLPAREFNIVPFMSIFEDIGAGRLKLNENLLGNILIFIPVGIFISLFRHNKKIIFNLVIVLFISLFVEMMQFLTNTGIADIDDLLLNGLGGLVGLFIYKLIAFKRPYLRTKKVVTILSAIIGFPVINLYIYIVIYGKVNYLP
jgi:glycopeptide antibiotics resistance protein